MSRSMVAVAFVATTACAQDAGRSLTVEVVTHDGRPAPWARVFVSDAESRWLLWKQTQPMGVVFEPDAAGRVVFSADVASKKIGPGRSGRWRVFVPVAGGLGPFAELDPRNPPTDPVRLTLPPVARIEVELESVSVGLGGLALGWQPNVACGPPDRLPLSRRRHVGTFVSEAPCSNECQLDDATGLRRPGFEPLVFGPASPGAFFVLRVSDEVLECGREAEYAIRPVATGVPERYVVAGRPALFDVRVRLAESHPSDRAQVEISAEPKPPDARPLDELPYPVEEKRSASWREAGGLVSRTFRVPVRRTAGPVTFAVSVRPPRLLDGGEGEPYEVEVVAKACDDDWFDLGLISPPSVPSPHLPTPEPAVLAAYRATLPRRGFAAECRGWIGSPRPPAPGVRRPRIVAADGVPTELATLWVRDHAGRWSEQFGLGEGLYEAPPASDVAECLATAPGHAGRRVSATECEGEIRLAPRRVSMAAVRLIGDELPPPPRALAVRLVYAGPPDAATARPDPDHPFSRQVGGGMRLGTERRAWWFVREPGRYVVRMFVVDPVLGRYDVPPTEAPEDVGEVVVRDEDAVYSVDVGLTEHLRRAVRR